MTALSSHWKSMSKYIFWACLVLAFAGGIFAGWVDFNNDEPQAVVLVILVVTFLLGMTIPGKAWLWAIIVSLCLPAVYLFARSLGYQPESPPSPAWYASLLVLIPGFIGAYLGAAARAILNATLVKSKN